MSFYHRRLTIGPITILSFLFFLVFYINFLLPAFSFYKDPPEVCAQAHAAIGLNILQ